MSQFTINETELIIFRSLGISDAGIQRLVAYTDGQCNRCIRIRAVTPSALVLSAVVIRRRMVEMLSVFLFSEAFSK